MDNRRGDYVKQSKKAMIWNWSSEHIAEFKIGYLIVAAIALLGAGFVSRTLWNLESFEQIIAWSGLRTLSLILTLLALNVIIQVASRHGEALLQQQSEVRNSKFEDQLGVASASHDVILRDIGFIIEHLGEGDILEGKAQSEIVQAQGHLLRVIEDLAIAHLGLDTGSVTSALLTAFKGNDEKQYLQACAYSTQRQGRSRTKRRIDYTNPQPAAVQAYVRKEIVYVNNVHSNQFKKFFRSDAPYRSVLAIPLLQDKEDRHNIVGVATLDCVKVNGFKKGEQKAIIEYLQAYLRTLCLTVTLHKYLGNLMYNNRIEKELIRAS